MVKFIACLLALFVFTACGASEGEVYDKDHIAAYTSYETVSDYIVVCSYDPNLKINTCKNQWVGSHEEPRSHKECFQVKFRNADGDTGKKCVSEYKWNEIDVGDWYQDA
jgi:hypothetical protein